MEDKIFEFMEKMYSDLSKRLDGIDGKLDKKSDKNDIVRMENDLQPKVETALEGYKLVYEKLEGIENKIDQLSSRIEKQEVEVRVIKGGKFNVI